MTAAQDILQSARDWKQLRQRQARETLRTVYLVDEKYIIKKFEIPVDTSRYRRPWMLEQAALSRAPAGCVPVCYGFVENHDADKRIVFLVKGFVPGRVIDRFHDEDMPAAARLLAGLHRNLVITDDANAQNFLKKDDGSMAFIDLGRAIVFESPSLKYYIHTGRELAKFRREGLCWNRVQWKVFLRHYFADFSGSRPTRILITISCAGSSAMRTMRKLLQFKNPR